MATSSAARANLASNRGLTNLKLIGCFLPVCLPSSTKRPIGRSPSNSSAQCSSRTSAPARRQASTRYGCGALLSLVTHRIPPRRPAFIAALYCMLASPRLRGSTRPDRFEDAYRRGIVQAAAERHIVDLRVIHHTWIKAAPAIDVLDCPPATEKVV